MSKTFGERISVEAANKYISAYDEVKKGMSHFKAPDIVSDPELDAKIKMCGSYSKSEFNCFIFSKSIIDELMALKDRNGKNPEYLMIHFAAHPKDKEKPGEPTLVILGCNKVSDNEYISMKAPDPGGETPGKIVQASFPPELTASTIIFKEKK